MRPEVRDRLWAGIGTGMVVGALGVVLVLGLSVDVRHAAQTALTVLTIAPPPPPPPPPIPHPVVAARARHAAAPRALRTKATAVVAPPPIVTPPEPPPVVVAPRADVGAAARTGASDRPGSGQGAGGRGDGPGGGGDGDGDGDVAPEQIAGRLKPSDLPLELRVPGVEYRVGVYYHIGTDGRVDDCTITRSSGTAYFDERVCRLIEQRFRFRPPRHADGRPHEGHIRETQTFGIDRSDYPPDGR